jgi:UrcA family protein
MSTQFRLWFAATALTAAVLSPALPVMAHAGDQDANRVVSARMAVAHVDFTDPSQVDGVYRNLKTQARYVCDVAASYDKDYDTRAERACEADAVAGAIHDINQPALSRLDADRTGKSGIELSLNSPQR